MADIAAIAVPIVQPLINKLSSGVWKELGLIWGVDKDLGQLQMLLITISDVLYDAERRSISDKALHNWLKSIKDAAFDADDVVDELQTEAVCRMHTPLTGKVRHFFSPNNPIAFRSKMAHKIKDLMNRFDKLAQLRRDFHLQEGSSSIRPISMRETRSVMSESEVYGRGEDLEKVIDLLVNRDNDKDLSVIPIVGLGGVGKTRFVSLVYKDSRIEDHFELKMWLSVGVDFDARSIRTQILSIANKKKIESMTADHMRQLLRVEVIERKFLLVLDDVWTKDYKQWEMLKNVLIGGKNGSKIIVTTRNEMVARIVGTVATPYKMKGLSLDDCWEIFREAAFGPGRQAGNPRLIEIGKEMVKTCGGIPFAAKTLGSLMGCMQGEEEWITIKNSKTRKFGEEEILSTLKLSYDYLPSNLKQCFAYCSIFPKGYEINRLKLIQMWIAQGFIPTSRNMDEEDIDDVKDDSGQIVSCKLPYLIHDLACYVAVDEFSTVNFGVTENVMYRYTSVIFDGQAEELILNIGNEAKQLRSLHLLSKTSDKYMVDRFELGLASSVTSLRVLDFSDISIRKFPSHIMGKLKHLRFLDISCSEIEILPNSIITLYNLQTLNLKNCKRLHKLPTGMKKLGSLRHLDITGCYKLTGMPRGLGRLSSLQTLSLFVIGKEKEFGTISELQNLNHIRGELEISGLENVKDPKEAKNANFERKDGLKSLKFCYDGNNLSAREDVDVQEEVLEGLCPHLHLKHLIIENYNGSKLPNWLSDPVMLPYLKKLKLSHLRRCEILPPLHQLPSLEHLTIIDCPLLIARCQEGGEDWHKIARIPYHDIRTTIASGEVDFGENIGQQLMVGSPLKHNAIPLSTDANSLSLINS